MMTDMAERRRGSADRPSDLLSVLLETPDKEAGRKWTVEEVTDEMLSLYFGASIMKIALVWMFYLLSTHPAVARRLDGEVRTVLGGRMPTPEDLAHLPYAEMVFQEATRLFPPVWGYPRYAAEAVEIEGYRFPRKSLLLPVGYFAHRHPEFWENPEGFDPERFTPERAKRLHPFAHYPFGGGPRMCLGRNLAPLICQLILVTVVQRYALHFAPQYPGDPVPEFAFELGPRDRLLMTVHRAGGP
jgi:cytochrome P450